MNCALKVNNVSKKAKDFQILHNVSFELEKGEIVGLIGPNGAGKTSIMKILPVPRPPLPAPDLGRGFPAA